MITPTNLVQHLMTYLPLYSDLFTSSMTISSATMGAGNILTVNATGHGKTVGKSVVLTAGTIRNPLTASLLDGETVIFTTGSDHDLIRPSLPLDDYTLELDGFGDDWDGGHIIIDVQNRRNFSINLPDGYFFAPVVDGSQYLMESIFTGVQTVATVPDADSFTIDLSSAPEYPTGTVDGLRIISGFRIAAAADFKRAQAAYSEHGADEIYLFVIMTDTDVSKDRHTLNDGVAGFTRQDEMLLRLMQLFSTVVFIPTTGEISGSVAQTLAHGSIFTALIGSLFGYSMPGSLIQYKTVPVGHGPGEYNTAYYTHVYEWQLPGVINFEDSFIEQSDVAFRDMVQTLQFFADEQAEMVSNINLDDEPL